MTPAQLAAQDLVECYVFTDIYKRLVELHHSPEEERYLEFKMLATDMLGSSEMVARGKVEPHVASLARAVRNFELETYDTWKESWFPLQLTTRITIKEHWMRIKPGHRKRKLRRISP